MSDTANRVTWGVAGLIVGLLIGSGVYRWPFHMAIPHIGVPEALFFFGPFGLFIMLWIVLIAVAIKWLFNPRDRSRARLADLPADFDDWHRRAHAQMAREAASADDSGRRG